MSFLSFASPTPADLVAKEIRQLPHASMNDQIDAYVRSKTLVLDLDQFPHWQKIRDNLDLTKKEKRERHQAIQDVIASYHKCHVNSSDWGTIDPLCATTWAGLSVTPLQNTNVEEHSLTDFFGQTPDLPALWKNLFPQSSIRWDEQVPVCQPESYILVAPRSLPQTDFMGLWVDQPAFAFREKDPFLYSAALLHEFMHSKRQYLARLNTNTAQELCYQDYFSEFDADKNTVLCLQDPTYIRWRQYYALGFYLCLPEDPVEDCTAIQSHFALGDWLESFHTQTPYHSFGEITDAAAIIRDTITATLIEGRSCHAPEPEPHELLCYVIAEKMAQENTCKNPLANALARQTASAAHLFIQDTFWELKTKEYNKLRPNGRRIAEGIQQNWRLAYGPAP